MTPREIGICERVNIARKEIVKWSQPDLARALGITQNQLAGIEYRRAPLRFGHAKFLCEKFSISQRWLALGTLPMQPRYDVPMEYSYLVKQNSLFSWVFDGFLDGQTREIEEAWIKEDGEENFRAGKFAGLDISVLQMPVTAYAEGAVRNAQKLIGITLNWLPEDLQLAYSDILFDAHKLFQTKHAKQIAKLEPPALRKFLDHPAQTEKSGLTNVSVIDNNEGVKAKLPALIKRLNEATKERGTKTALAKYVGVPLPKISQWLSGEHEPGGETTLKLLHWVEQWERQK